jgi:BolA protein
MSDRVEKIRGRLTEKLQPTHLDIIDQSHLHAGHAGAKEGKGHFAVEITSSVFADKSIIQRHRLVYDALGDLMQSDIHALSIKASVNS